MVVAVAGLLLALAFSGVAWWWVDRGPPRGTIIPLPKPPAGMSAAAVRYIAQQEGFDQGCFTAAILDLCASGHLGISERGGWLILERRDGGRPIPLAEQTMKEKLFKLPAVVKLLGKGTLVLDEVSSPILRNARDALHRGLSQAYDGKLFREDPGWMWWMIALLYVVQVIAVLEVVMKGAVMESDDKGGIFAVMLILGWICFRIGVLLSRLGRSNVLQTTNIIRGFKCAVWTVAGFLLLAVTAGSTAVRYGGDMGGIAVAVTCITAAVLGVGNNLLSTVTPTGRKMMDHIEGFRMYLSVAEKDRLEIFYPADKTPESFELLLPYAIALEVENTWAKHFAEVLDAACTEPQDEDGGCNSS